MRRNRDFRILLFGDLVNTFGSKMSTLAFPLAAMTVTDAPVLIGLVGASGMLALAVVGIPAGAFVDRHHKKHVMVATTLMAATICSIVVFCIVADVLSIAILVAGAFAIACCDAVYDPANATAVQRVVPKHQLSTALSLEQGRNGVAELLGPPAAGVLFATGRALPFLVDCLTYVVSAFCALRIRHDLSVHSPRTKRGRVPASSERDQESKPAAKWLEAFAGVRFVWRSDFLRPVLGIASVLNVALNGFVVMLIVALGALGTPVAVIGLVQAGAALGLISGAALAGIVLRRVRAGLCLQIGTAAVASGMLATAVVVDVWPLVMLTVLLTFVSLPALNAALFTYAMSSSPEDLQGRVRSGIMTMSMLFSPLGPILGGLVASLASPTTALAALGGLALVCLGVTLTARGVRNAPVLAEL